MPFKLLLIFINLLSCSNGFKFKALYTTNGGEFKAFLPYLCSYGIQPHFSCPHTPQQNGVAERKYRHIAEMSLTLLAHAHMPLSFQVSAFQTVVYLINLLPSVLLNFLCPFELLYHKQPHYFDLQSFGCTCFPYLRPYNGTNLTFIRLSVFLLVIVMIMRVINVYIHWAQFIFPDMFTLTLMNFPISPYFSHSGNLHMCLILLDRPLKFFILFQCSSGISVSCSSFIKF